MGRKLFQLSLIGFFLLAACGQSDQAASVEVGAVEPEAGVRLVSPQEAAAIQADPPPDLVVLDVRTPEEFNEAHLDGAIMLDFYDDDFRDELAALDRDVPYVVYCRSGNRSGQTAAMMTELGFADVADVDGGIVSWLESGLPVATP